VQTHLQDVERAREHVATRNWSADDREHMNIAILAVDERLRRLEIEEAMLRMAVAGLRTFCEQIAEDDQIPERGAFKASDVLVLFGKDTFDTRSNAERERLREHVFSYGGFVEAVERGVWAFATVGPRFARMTAEEGHRHVWDCWGIASGIGPEAINEEASEAWHLLQSQSDKLMNTIEVALDLRRVSVPRVGFPRGF
jgi:hypothetical protein